MKAKHISMSITERCNLNCIYCFEKSKINKKMDFQTAIKLIDEEIMHSDEYDTITVDFMGGEPFLEFELIKKVCEYHWNRETIKPVNFYTTTNGTLVHGDIKKWLEENHTRFTCALSLDGVKEAHDINRCNSFDKIDIEFFRTMWPKQKVKSIVSEKTLSMLNESVQYLHKLGFPNIEIKLAYGFDWTESWKSEVFIEQLEKLIEFYLIHPEYVPCTFLNLKINKVLDPVSKIEKWCHAGGKTVSYDMDGNKYPCRYFQDLRKASLLSLEQMWEVNLTEIQNSLQGVCRNCILRNLCRTCYALNFETNGHFGKKPLTSCKVTRDMAYMTAKLNKAKLEEKTNITCEEQDVVRACDVIFEAYNTNSWIVR